MQNNRREAIIDLVTRRGFVSVEALAQHFGVTSQTIRRDINQLCEEGVLCRYHGGAGLPSSVENIAYPTRKIQNLQAKQAIARMLAGHIPDHASLFINIGTTTEAVAEALAQHKDLRIITNNLHVASLLTGRTDFAVTIAGGTVRPDGGIVGEATIDFIRQFKVDIGIIGISGIDQDGTLLDFDYREVRVSQAIIANSRRVFLAVDHSKFGRNAMVRLGHITQVSALFTDRSPPPAIAVMLDAADVALHVTEASLTVSAA